MVAQEIVAELDVARALLRSTYASLIIDYPSRELVARRSFAVALVDSESRVVAATAHAHLANVEAVARTCARAFDNQKPGDVVVTNDPYSGGTRVQDHFVLSPVFDADDDRCGFAVVCAPLYDVGGMTLGNDVPQAGDLWTEGVRTTPVQVRRAGVVDEDVMRLLALNSRVPVLVRADLAVLSEVAVTMAQGALPVLAQSLADEVVERTRITAARALAEARAGERRRTVRQDQDPEELLLALRLSSCGERLVADFAGSSGERRAGHLNATIHTTTSAVARAVQLIADCPLNSGVTASLSVSAPEASIVNCSYPLAVGGSLHVTCRDVFELTRECLTGEEGGL